MRKIELLAPAGDLERLKYAILYGADAVFIGGKHFSLRSMASNFTLDDIKEGCKFAHEHNAKVHVTCNIVMHNSDLEGLIDYLKSLELCGVDAIIASSFTIAKLVKKYTKMEAHISTQQSISNSKGVEFCKNIGANRVVLARECSLENIKEICKNSPIDIEVFIHGGMCASVSGRCMLSNIMTNRDANRGGCAQSCRWNYDIYQEDNKISNNFNFTMSSADLNAIEYIPNLIDAGVSSLKIEGRMKSLHYIATIVNAYRMCIDEYYKNGFIEDINKYKFAIARGENRQTSHGFLEGKLTVNEEIYNDTEKAPNHEFTGIIISYDKKTGKVIMEQRNIFYGNRQIEILNPHIGIHYIKIDKIYDIEGNEIEAARHAQMKVVFYINNETLEQYDLVR